MARDNKTEALAGVQLFSSLNKKELGLVAKASDVVIADAGTELVAEGSSGHEFYLLLEGEATVRRHGRRIAALGPGDYFGELALLDGGVRSATVTAETPARLLVVGLREFSAVLEDVPAVAHKLLVGMAARLRHADTRAFSH
jgi:CRP/FNR family cyclic AMP-dependent transcriptional regulator